MMCFAHIHVCMSVMESIYWENTGGFSKKRPVNEANVGKIYASVSIGRFTPPVVYIESSI